METHTDSDISILSQFHETLKSSPDATQRDIAQKNNMSLGMTNAVLKRFIQKGWIMARRLSPKKVCYMLTPDGVKLVASRTYNYMQRTFKLMNEYQNAIVKKIAEIKSRGFNKIVLFGQSDIAFLIEYACKENEMAFCVKGEADCRKKSLEEGAFGLLAENEEIGGLQTDESIVNVMDMVK